MAATDYDYFTRKSHVPAFGSWEYYDNDFPIPFTQCFESATQADLLRYGYGGDDRDLYVAGDLYADIVAPAMIVVPRRNRKGKGESYKIGGKRGGRKDAWVVCPCDCDCDLNGGSSPALTAPAPPKRAAKAVDEDLYKISPDLLRVRPKQRRVWGFLPSCLLPCAC